MDAKKVISELAPTGTMRAAVNLGNSVLVRADPETKELSGIAVDLAQKIAHQLGIPVAFVRYASAGEAFAALDAAEWDLAFLAIDAKRAEKVRFSRPYFTIEGAYLARESSAVGQIDDVDRPGIEIAVAAGAAYDLFLSKSLVHATLVRARTPQDAMTLFLTGQADVAAGVRPSLEAIVKVKSGLRLLPGHFMTIPQGVATPIRNRIAGEFVSKLMDEILLS